MRDKEATPELIGPLQDAVNKQVPGAWITVRQLQTNPVETPVEILISGQADTDPRTESGRHSIPSGNRVPGHGYCSPIAWNLVLRDDWGPDSPQMKIEIDPDRANLVGITNADVATPPRPQLAETRSVIIKRETKNIPIVVRLRPQDRARLSQIENLYVNSSQENVKVPLLSVATLKDIRETARIRRREHFRTISILCFPEPGVLASEVLGPIEPKLMLSRVVFHRGINYRSVGKRRSKSKDSRLSPSFF